MISLMQFVPIQRDGGVHLGGVALAESLKPVIAQTVQMYNRNGYVEPWLGYLAIEGGDCVGTCAFTAPPAGGGVEIAYFTFPAFEKRGIATRMAGRLVEIARESNRSVRIIAHTLTEENASTRILRKLGFVLNGTITHPEDGCVWLWSHAILPARD